MAWMIAVDSGGTKTDCVLFNEEGNILHRSLSLGGNPLDVGADASRRAALEVLRDMLPILERQEDFSREALEALCRGYVEEHELKNGRVLWPLRTAVSGKQMTPGGAYELMEILGKEETLSRIRKGIEKLEADISK